MGLDVGGYHDRPDWPKMGPSLLIASCLILAIRTARWNPILDPSLANQDMNDEIQFAIKHGAPRLLGVDHALRDDLPTEERAPVSAG